MSCIAWRGGGFCCGSGSSACSRMTEFNHSPRVIPERRAACLAAARASVSMPFTLHGMPGFIPALTFRFPRDPRMPDGDLRPLLKVNVLGKNYVKGCHVLAVFGL